MKLKISMILAEKNFPALNAREWKEVDQYPTLRQ
jgi:hypothetical protein